MRRILIWRQIKPHNELDIFRKTDYSVFFKECKAIFGEGGCPNWGNKLWFQGLYSEIENKDENEIIFRSAESIEEINEQFDMIIYPMANFFSVEHKASMPELAQIFQKITIPVYIIACGAQAAEYRDLNWLIDQIGEPAKQFISSIYQTGGEFALRGEFTKAFFDKLGFPTAVVTGCPSMYQMGSGFKVSNTKVDLSVLKPVVNGKIQHVGGILKHYPQSEYMDQDLYFRCLYELGYCDNLNSLHDRIVFYHYMGGYSAELLAQNRIKMIADMNNWYSYLREEGFNYSIGSRIHGNIMSILSGIPATVLAIDTRTQEMAEFFNIPYVRVQKGEKLSIKRVEQFYMDADYSDFNRTYLEKYHVYESFLRRYGIVSSINQHNSFFEEADCRREFEQYTVNQQAFSEVAAQISKQKTLIRLGSAGMSFKNWVRENRKA